MRILPYDGLFQQLTAVSRGTDSGYQSFTMNNIGDIQSVSSDGTTTNRTTNADNQITNIGSATISYDNNGNVTTDDKGNTLVYDAWNRLVECQELQRGFGCRIYLRWTWTHDERNRRHHHD